MELFQKAINNDFDSLSYDEILEIYPLLYYSLPDIHEFLLSTDLSSHQATKLENLNYTISNYTKEVPFNSLLAETVKYQQNKKLDNYESIRKFNCIDFDSTKIPEQKFRIVLQEIANLITISDQCKFEYSDSEILNNTVFHAEIKLIICVLIHEKPLLWRISNIVRGLLHCRGGLQLIKSLALNFPHQWHTICYSIIDSVNRIQMRTNDCGSENLSFLLRIIKTILDLNPSHIYSVFEYCLSRRVLAELVLTLALDLSEAGQMCILDFLKLVLLDDDQETCRWFTTLVKTRKETELIKKMKCKLIAVAKTLINEDSNSEMPIENIVNSQLLLKILAALRSFAEFKFEPELSYYLMKIVTHKLPIIPASVEFIQISVAFMLCFKSNFYFDSRFPCNFDSVTTIWLQSLLKIQTEFSAVLEKSYLEFLLLLALIYNTQRIGEVEKIVNALFGFQVRDHSLKICAKMITQDVFGEKVLTTQAANVPVNQGLNSKMSGHLAVNCVLQLIKSRSFSRNNVQINKWIFRQVCESASPMHPKLITLLNSFVDTLLPTDNWASNEPIREADIFTLFDPSKGPETLNVCSVSWNYASANVSNVISSYKELTPHVLMLYYLLILYDSQTKKLENDVVFRNNEKVIYSNKLWQTIPIKYLLVYTRQNSRNFQELYPVLLKLITKYYPHLICGDNMIQDEILLKNCLLANPQAPPLSFTLNDLCKEFDKFDGQENGDASQLMRYLYELAGCPAECVVVFAGSLVSQMAQILDNWCPTSKLIHRLLMMYNKIWIKLHLLMTQKLELMTINAVQHIPGSDTDFLSLVNLEKRRNWTIDNILENPVEILLVNVKPNVFRCVPVLELYLRILESVQLQSGSHWYCVQVHQQPQKQSQQLQSQSQQQLQGGQSQQIHFTEIGGVVTENSSAALAILSRNRRGELDTLRKTLLQNLSATMVQLLLEKCLPDTAVVNGTAAVAAGTSSDTGSDGGALLSSDDNYEDSLEHIKAAERINLATVQRLICNFIHSMFINDQDLCHIVHWQTYPQPLLPVAIRGIASMHINLDALEKHFLNSGDYYKMVFMLDLVSHISLFYSVKKAQDEATKLLLYFRSVIQSIVGLEERPVLLWLTVKPIMRIAATFPNLLSTVTAYLIMAASLCINFCALKDDCICAYQGGDDESEMMLTEKQFSILSLEDQYQVCYVRLLASYEELLQSSMTQSLLHW